MEYFIGIDVSKETLDIHQIDRNGRPIDLTTAIPNTVEAIRQLLNEFVQPHKTIVVYESTGAYGKKLACVLARQVAMVCEVNPMIIKNAKLTMTQTSTDPTAARAIAEAARHLYLINPSTLIKYNVDTGRDPELAVWISEYNRLHKAIAKLLQQIDTIKQLPQKAARIVEKRLNDQLNRMRISQKQVAKHIEQHASGEDVQLVASIKGVGLITAATIVNRIGSIDRFESSDQLKSYLGIYPAIRQSGKSKGKARLAKHGDKLIRHQLFNCAKSAAKFNPACRELYNRLIKKGHKALYAWVAVMRKLVQIIYGVLKNKTPWNPNLPLTQNG